MCIIWMTRKWALFKSGSGIPQVIASLSVTHGQQKVRLIELLPTLCKIPQTFFSMLLGASMGRESSSVQIEAVMYA